MAAGRAVAAQPPASLVDLLDRLMAGGVVLNGEVTLSIAGVDLVRVSLRALVSSVRAGMAESAPAPGASGDAGPGRDPVGTGSGVAA